MKLLKLNSRFAKFAGPTFLEGQDIYTSDTVKDHPFGFQAFGNHGKLYRYASAGGVTLVVGNALQSMAEDTQFENMAVLASAIVQPYNGLQTVNVTNGTTTVVAAAYVGGSLSVYTTPDAGSEYDIQAITGTLTTGGALTVQLDHQLGTAWTTSTKVNMKKSPWSDIIQAPTTQTGVGVGLAIYAIPTTNFGWVLTHGIGAVLSDSSTYAVGSEIGYPCANTAGAPAVYAAGTTHQKFGTVQQAQASTHWISAFVQID